MPSFIPYYWQPRNNVITVVGLTYEKAVELQSLEGGTIGPDLDHLPPRRREPIRDIELTPAPPYVEVGGEQRVTPSTVSERRAGPDCYSPVPPASAELASGSWQDAGPGVHCPETVPAPEPTPGACSLSSPASGLPGPSFELREWARRQCRKVLRQLGKESA